MTKIYNVEQYYELNGKVATHLVSCEKTLEEAFNDMLEAHNNLGQSFVIVFNMPKEEMDYYVLNRLEEGKGFLTVVESKYKG